MREGVIAAHAAYRGPCASGLRCTFNSSGGAGPALRAWFLVDCVIDLAPGGSGVKVVILPFDWLRIFVVLTDVVHEFAIQVFYRSEDAAGDHITLDAREPTFHLVEPRRVGRREVQTDVAMSVEEVGDPRRLMAADVVTDDVDFPAFGLTDDDIGQKGYELFACVALMTRSRCLRSGAAAFQNAVQ